MSPEQGKSPFVSEWIREPRTAEEFTSNFERSRNIYIRPLTHAYRHLVASENLLGTDLLCLGIGTGKVEEMMRLDPARITGIDFNQSLLDKAKTRLPKARFIQGRMEDVIGSVDYTSTTLTQEALDCIPPRDLPKVVSQIKTKTDKLVAVQTYSPDPEFYGSSWQGAGHAIGGTGIEDITSSQQQSLEARLNTLGVQSSLDEPQQMLIEIQKSVEKLIGARFNTNIVEALEQIAYPFDKTKLPATAGLRSLPAQASLLLNHVELQVEKQKNIFKEYLANRPREAGIYIGMDTTHRFLQIMLGTFRIDLFQQLLADACVEAGFGNIQRKTIVATEKRVVTPQELMAQINRSLDVIKHKPVARRIRVGDKGSRAFVGSPVILMEPNINPYSIARVPYLVAA